MQKENNNFTRKVFCAECGSAFGRKNWTTSQGKRKVWQCNNRYRVKGQIGCQNNYIDEETLEKAVVMAVELLSENVDLLHGKWNKILEEKRPLEKHYSLKLAEMINKPLWEFDYHEMCQILDNIIITEDGQITVRFLEGTEVDLQSRRKVIMTVGYHCGYSFFLHFCDRIHNIRDSWSCSKNYGKRNFS